MLPEIRNLVCHYLDAARTRAGLASSHGQRGSETTEDQLTSSQQLLRLYADKGPFLLDGPGLAADGCGSHSLPVVAVLTLTLAGTPGTVLVVLDRNRARDCEEMITARRLALGIGVRNAVQPRVAMNERTGVAGDPDRTCLQLMDADAVIRHTYETHAHFQALGMPAAAPGVQYMTDGIPGLTPVQVAQLRPLVKGAFRNGEVETYRDIDYAGYAHRSGVSCAVG